MRSKFMTILRREAPATNAAVESSVNRRVEVTVERETVTILVRGQPAQSQQTAASERAGAESERLELPPPVPELPDKSRA
jgi:hypothetical protein